MRRRRLGLLHAGSALSFCRFSWSITGYLLQGRHMKVTPALMFALVILCGFPLTMAYGIVVQRALDVRVGVVRMGVQYALAQGSVPRAGQLVASAGRFPAVLLALDPNTNRPRKIC